MKLTPALLLAGLSLAAPLTNPAALAAPQPLHEGEGAPMYEAVPPPWLEPFPGPHALQIEDDPSFSGWLETRQGFRSTPADDAYSTLPLTAELWAAVRPSPHQPQVLLCGNIRESVHYWELGVDPGNNKVYAYLPGRSPERIWSATTVDDLRWHHLALKLEEEAAELVVDGHPQGSVSTRPSDNADLKDERGGLMIGAAATRWRPTSDARIGDIRIRRGLHDIEDPKPQLDPDEHTIGAWRFDADGNGGGLAGAPDLEVVVRHPQELITVAGVPLDAVDLAAYGAGPAPMAATPVEIQLSDAPQHPEPSRAETLLDGSWEMAEGGTETERLSGGQWGDAISAEVPGSVHTALERAGIIPDPKLGKNDAIAREQSSKTWWLRRSFSRPEGPPVEALLFDGVAISCTVWLNGERLGDHNGMFGGPHFPIDRLEEENELVVRLDPAPQAPGWLIQTDNNGWRETVVFNNVWGWHYSNIPAIGIWRSVRLKHAEAVNFEEPPFVATHDVHAGVVDLSVKLRGGEDGWEGTLLGTVRLEGSSDTAHGFAHPVKAAGSEHVRLRFHIPDHQVWWPNGYGEQPLYDLDLTFVPTGEEAPSARQARFGIRSLRMAPAPGGPQSSLLNWTFVINGKPMFMRGSGWCTLDSSMDFSRERYDRFLRAAKQQNNVMVRAWGSGMPETDDFYELCDRYGLLVMQEWPTAWDSHEEQPQDALEETVRLNTLRLRNHPSLVMWGGGNESWAVFTPMINLMGRISQELDGTRPFHRTEAYGGSTHNYGCWWDRKPLDHNLQLTGLFLGEFGIPSVPVEESVRRYLPEAEQGQWPPSADGSFAHHTPTFNDQGWGQDLDRLKQYAGYFTDGETMARFIRGSQLAQVVGLRHTLELARIRWPESTGALYYKLNDNYPAASWATWDWYGAPKIAHWFVRSAFAPLHAVIHLPKTDLSEDTGLAVHLLDDTGARKGHAWSVRVRAYGEGLAEIASTEWSGQGGSESVSDLGKLELKADDLQSDAPVFLLAEVYLDGELADRSWSFANFERRPDSLFQLPITSLEMKIEDAAVRITNTGGHPAVGVEVLRPGHADTFTPGAGMLWLAPGESRRVEVDHTKDLQVQAWNVEL